MSRKVIFTTGACKRQLLSTLLAFQAAIWEVKSN
jgi:hypothetical protein